MSDYGWVITKDYIEDGHANGTMGPKWVTLSEEHIRKHGKKFRMYDDDGELYYEGYNIENEDPGPFESDPGFEPLDDFGMPNAGCTYIEYLENGKWEAL